MSSTENTCPHCGSQQSRLLSDHQGSVGWCGDCHRAWILTLHRAMTPQFAHPPERQRRVA